MRGFFVIFVSFCADSWRWHGEGVESGMRDDVDERLRGVLTAEYAEDAEEAAE